MKKGIKWAFAAPLLALIATSAYAGGPDVLWEVTVKMEMAGMPMAMPARTSQVCVKKDEHQKAVPMDKNCKVFDFQHSGNKTTYSFKCTGDMEMTGKGQATYSGDSYQGSMQARGPSFEMKQSYTGKRIGYCTAEDAGKQVAAAQAQQKQSMDMACTPKGDMLQWQLYEPGQGCASHRDAFCKRAKDLAGEMTEPAKFAELKRSPDLWREGMRRCGVDVAAIQPAACKKANSKRNWNFVADNCEKEAQAIAAKECAGRDFTSAMSSEYAPVCRAYAKGKPKVANVALEKDDKKAEAKKAEDKSAPAALMDSVTDTFKGGLKGKFGF
jgi:hypothetical protein